MEINIVEMNARLYKRRGRHCLQKLTRIFEQPEVITFWKKITLSVVYLYWLIYLKGCCFRRTSRFNVFSLHWLHNS